MQKNAYFFPASTIFGRTGAAALCYCVAVFTLGCSEPGSDERRRATPTAMFTSCNADGAFKVDTFGAIEASIDWRNDEMSCEGMKRPNKRGARLRFAGTLNTDAEPRNLAFILALPDLVEGQTGTDLATRITLIEEDAGRFFSTRETNICWANIEHHQPKLESDRDVKSRRYLISGLVYCVAPIADLSGAGSITISDLRFSGRVAWAGKK